MLLGDVFISLPTAARKARDGLGRDVTSDIGDGGFERFQPHPTTPTIPGVLSPTAFRVH